MIKDTADTPMIVFKSVNFARGGAGVYYYDIKENKEIARAQSAHLFVKYLPMGDDRSSDKLSFLRVPTLSSSTHDSLEEVAEAMTNHMLCIMFMCKAGVPSWYTVDVDFAAARSSEEMIELIDMENNDSE